MSNPLVWFHGSRGKVRQPRAPEAELEDLEGQEALLLLNVHGGVHCRLGGCGWTGSWPFLPVSRRRMASM